MSKTFKSSSQANDNRTLSVEKLYGVPRLMISGDVQMGILLDPSDTPALCLAILEAAGYTEDDTEIGPRKNLVATDYSLGMRYLRFGIEEQLRKSQANKEAEAKEQAELEAEALELFNTLQVEMHGILGTNWVPVAEFPNIETKRKWLAVACKAREMRAEK